MKRLLTVVALAAVGCGAQKPAPDQPESPGMTLLADITGSVDAGRGVTIVEATPSRAGLAFERSRRVKIPASYGTATDTVKVANGLSTWATANRGATYCSNAAVTGGFVNLTDNFVDPDGTTYGFLSPVYAQITWVSSAGTVTPCGTAAAPSGLSAQYGLWKYPAFINGDSWEVEWNFAKSSDVNFTFQAKLYGSIGYYYSGDTYPLPTVNVNPVTVGTDLAYAVRTSSQALAFIHSDGTSSRGSSALPANSNATGLALGASKIWYTTDQDSTTTVANVGYKTDAGDAGQNVVGDTGGLNFFSPSENPISTAQVWFLETGTVNAIRSASGSPLALSLTKTTLPSGRSPTSLAFDAGTGNFYVTAKANGVIYKYVASTLSRTAISTSPTCPNPDMIIPGPSGTMYFASSAGLCSLSTAGNTVTLLGGTGGASALTLTTTTGEVWAVNNTGVMAERVTTTNSNPWQVDLGNASNQPKVSTVGFAAGYVWAVLSDGVGAGTCHFARIQP